MRIEKSFLYLGIVLMPFIGTVDVAKKIFFPLGSGLFLFLLLGSFFWIIRRPHIILPSRRILLFIALFAGLYFISGTINISFMFQSTWQGVRGVDRFLLSSGLWSVEFVLLLYIYNIYVLKKDVREQVPLFLLVSFVLSAFCGCLELASTFGNNAAGELLAGIDSLYRGDLLRQPFRVQSFASEPSQYSVYLVVVFPLLLFKLIKSRRFFVYSSFFRVVVFNIFTYGLF